MNVHLADGSAAVTCDWCKMNVHLADGSAAVTCDWCKMNVHLADGSAAVTCDWCFPNDLSHNMYNYLLNMSCWFFSKVTGSLSVLLYIPI